MIHIGKIIIYLILIIASSVYLPIKTYQAQDLLLTDTTYHDYLKIIGS